MAAPKKYPEELRERAIRIADLRRDLRRGWGCCVESVSSWGSTPRRCATESQQAEIDAGQQAGTRSAEARRIAELGREVRELRRANDILKTASAVLAAAELDRRLK